MPSIRIKRFAGLLPQVDKKLLPNDHAQIAHNCLLWDGTLRPMPQWQNVGTYSSTVASLYLDPTNSTSGNNADYGISDLSYAFRNQGEPFNTTDILGIASWLQFSLGRRNPSTPNTYPLGLPVPVPTNIVQTVTPQNLSIYPISRTYAVTFVSDNMEGPPFVFSQLGDLQNGGTSIYEGDLAQIVFIVDPNIISRYNITGFRLYRTVPGFDTAEQVGNPLETSFHLVNELIGFPSDFITIDPSTGWWQFNYIDGETSAQIRGDLLLTDQFMPPQTPPGFFIEDNPMFGQLEGGWAFNVLSTIDQAPTYIQLSERFLYHAWPPQNLYAIPDVVYGVAAFYDNLFIGTRNKPYHMHVTEADGEALNVTVRPFPDTYACLSGTMTATNFGAMYISQDSNLIALTADGGKLASKSVASPGDAIPTPNITITFSSASRAGWWNGLYFAFTSQGVAAVFDQPGPSNADYPLGQLVTIDTPPGTPGPNVVTGRGFFSNWGSSVYNFALPGASSVAGSLTYDTAPKYNYTWKSKRYVMPGLTTFAAAKVVNDASGILDVTINGYNNGGETTPSFTYSRSLSHSKPFRIPHQFKCLEFDFVLSGTSNVTEFHIATSERDLTESPGE